MQICGRKKSLAQLKQAQQKRRGYNFTPQQAGIRERVFRTELSEPPVWRRGPRARIMPSRLCWYIVTDEWPVQRVASGTVVDLDEEQGVYILKELPSGRTRFVSISRVFTEPWVARKELMLVQKVARDVANLKPSAYSTVLVNSRAEGRIAKHATLAEHPT